MSRVPEPSVFLVVDEAKRRARERGVELIDLSIGSTDLPPPEAPLMALREALSDPRTYGYCLKSCTLPFLEAATTWYQGRYGVPLDPKREALALIGSQEGLAHLLLALTEPEDLLLLPEVAYPSYFGAARVASLRTYPIPLRPDGLADLKRVPEAVLREAKVLLLNYPNNPTGAVADWGYLEEALALAKRYGLWLIHDNPYVDQVYEGEAPSPLALPGAKERVVEFFSLSKSYNLAGFRLGFALGSEEAIGRLERVKGVIDFNQYAGILRLGVAALQTPREVTRGYAQVYRERALGMARALEGALALLPPRATMYLWGRLPQGVDDLDFALRLVERGVALAPGQGFGPGGRGFVRIALVRPLEDLLRAARIIREAL
ncbi:MULTISPECIES: aminotransferase class I/II-fold pyridoxal phosphate-dependent enzyme [Thermus]|jgi:aspartate/methionine/tyrosine aminotransferase|uniref:Aminotransferase n=1 Tax=Thermus brockianus TaxID=56956 RepID=A0A1J0LUK4_THEBO|nr:aminotransferase class I/II-fold pyridoxal phosphate-dependent enzyme [Thermus brockianus]APD09339.1 N-succinyldiaminopimelate aminotransferase [Thermus brockianus]